MGDLIVFKIYDSWPIAIKNYLDSKKDVLIGWKKNLVPAYIYDQVVYGLVPVMEAFFIQGFHCTKLVPDEIQLILDKWLALPNPEMLSKRISLLVAKGYLSESLSISLLNENESAELNRKDRIWFTFFEPYLAGEWSINSFFRY